MRNTPLPLVFCIITLSLSMAPCEPGTRASGKYRGVVVFDRWDGCILFSGTYKMYVSEKTKVGLREHAGKPVEIDAREVRQPINPANGLTGETEIVSSEHTAVKCNSQLHGCPYFLIKLLRFKSSSLSSMAS